MNASLIPRIYKCLPQREYTSGKYKLTSIRDEDKYAIMKWRNDQIDILRQKEPLLAAQQESYFAGVVSDLFVQEYPSQLLFSFFENNALIGYGGLVHIDWESRHGEISFITSTERTTNESLFRSDWKEYLKILKKIASLHLGFNKIYTYAYDVRPHLFTALLESSFVEEARLKSHVLVRGELRDVLIHSCFTDGIGFRMARSEDAQLYFEWANDETVRKNAFSHQVIPWDDHRMWYERKVRDNKSLLLVAVSQNRSIGQIRFDEISPGVFEIDFSIDKSERGAGHAWEIIRKGTAALALAKPNFKSTTAKVKKSNTPSRKAFLRAGYQLEESIDTAEFEVFNFENKVNA